MNSLKPLFVIFFVFQECIGKMHNLKGKSVEGMIIYPSSFPSTLKDGSCLMIFLNSAKDGSKHIAYQKMQNPSIKLNQKYSIRFPDKKINLEEKYFVEGMVNVGWCNNKIKKEKKKEGDYEATGGFLMGNKLYELTRQETVLQGPTLQLDKGNFVLFCFIFVYCLLFFILRML